MEENKTAEAPRDWKADLMRRIRDTKTTRWIRFGAVALLYCAWVIWMQRPIWFFGLLLLADIYITGYIPFNWWKKSNSRAVRTVMSWVDAIVYALVLVYFVFNFAGQNYQIPSSSLEKTLLTGDYLWVNKMAYGPRVPMTPVHFPLVHNTMPVINTKSYLDWPKADYRRLKGWRNVELGDIVVFNFPAGDTVATKFETSPEYYDVLVKKYGRERLHSDPATFGEIIYRPVDRRTNFVKRAVGLPGQRIKIVDDRIYLDGKLQKQPENAQFVYFVALRTPLTEDQVRELGIALSDISQINPQHPDYQYMAEALGVVPGNTAYLYQLPLTDAMLASLQNGGQLIGKQRWDGVTEGVFPDGVADVEEWSLSNYGGKDGLLIPKKGMTVELNPTTWKMYERCIRNYENHPDAYLKGNTVYIDGKPAPTYTFGMDYYFMMGDNRHLSQDSRFWGFVPEDHVVGTPVFVLISFDQERSMFNGGIRWNRILKTANPDK